MRFLLALVLATAASPVQAGLFGGPTIDGDTYSYNGKGAVYDPSSTFDDGNSYTDVYVLVALDATRPRTNKAFCWHQHTHKLGYVRHCQLVHPGHG